MKITSDNQSGGGSSPGNHYGSIYQQNTSFRAANVKLGASYVFSTPNTPLDNLKATFAIGFQYQLDFSYNVRYSDGTKYSYSGSNVSKQELSGTLVQNQPALSSYGITMNRRWFIGAVYVDLGIAAGYVPDFRFTLNEPYGLHYTQLEFNNDGYDYLSPQSDQFVSKCYFSTSLAIGYTFGIIKKKTQ